MRNTINKSQFYKSKSRQTIQFDFLLPKKMSILFTVKSNIGGKIGPSHHHRHISRKREIEYMSREEKGDTYLRTNNDGEILSFPDNLVFT